MNKNYLYIGLVVVIVLIGGVYLTSVGNLPPVSGREYVSSEVQNLQESNGAQVVELKDGDTYDLTASYVEKNIVTGKQIGRAHV